PRPLEVALGLHQEQQRCGLARLHRHALDPDRGPEGPERAFRLQPGRDRGGDQATAGLTWTSPGRAKGPTARGGDHGRFAAATDTKQRTKRTLVITADDYGYWPTYNQGIIEAVEMGAVMSVGAMVEREYCDPKPLLESGVEVGLHIEFEGRWGPRSA